MGREGGGVGLYVRHGLDARILASSPELCCGQPEYLLVSISGGGGRSLLLGIVYRPPKVGHLAVFRADSRDSSPLFHLR